MDAVEPDQPALPPREPRPFFVHWMIVSAVSFLVVLFPLLLLGAVLWPWIVAALLVGVAVAPVTQRMEAESLARRQQPPDSP
jgi:fatty acid desaturase